MQLELYDETATLTAEQLDQVTALMAVAADMVTPEREVACTVTFVTNDAIQVINRDYRGLDKPTDVISFALDDAVDEAPPLIVPTLATPLPHQLGDIIISVDRAAEQAEAYGHSFARELGFLAVHGFLHLNGYDHMTPSEEAEMFGLQERILQAYGLGRD